jgi:hypothetical protein
MSKTPVKNPNRTESSKPSGSRTRVSNSAADHIDPFVKNDMNLPMRTSSADKKNGQRHNQKQGSIPASSSDPSHVEVSLSDAMSQAANDHMSREQKLEIAQERRQTKKNLAMAALLLAISFVGIYYQYRKIESERTTVAATYYQDQLQKRVNHHKDETGFRINMERAKVDADNFVGKSSVQDGLDKSSPQYDVIAGLPLVPEEYHRENGRDRGVEVNSIYADARVQYALQEEQESVNWQEESRRQYIKEFVDKAQRAGYKVRVKGNEVELVPKARAPSGQPAFEDLPETRSSGNAGR